MSFTFRSALAASMFLWPSLFLTVSANAATTELLQEWQQQMGHSQFSGTVLVANSEGVVFHQAFGAADRDNKRPFDERTVFDIASLTKQFTATALMLLVEQGKLSLSDTIDKYFSDVPTDKRKITIHQLMSNSSGLPTNLPGYGPFEKLDPETFTSLVFGLPLVSAPGETYNYSNIGYGLLGQLIEIASGQNWESFVKDHVLLPAGLTQTGYRLIDVPHERLAINYGADPNRLQRMLGLNAKSRSVGDSLQHLRDEPGFGWFEGAGGFVSTAQDMHAWFLALRTKQILSESSWQQMFERHVPENSEETSFYGYGWVLSSSTNGAQRISHTGSNGYSYATIDYYPALELFIFTASNDIDNYPYPLIRELNQLLLQTCP